MHKVVFLCLLFLAFDVHAKVTIVQIDPFVKVLPGERYDRFNIVHATATGDFVTAQLLVKADANEKFILRLSSTTLPSRFFSNVVQYRVGYIQVTDLLTSSARDRLKSINSTYPDPLFKQTSFNLSKNIPLSILLDIPVSGDTKPGTHSVNIEVISTLGKKLLATTSINLQVFPILLPAAKLNYVNWYHDVSFQQLNNNNQTLNFSTEYWSIFKNIVDVTKRLGQNTFTINPGFLITYKKVGPGWVADYSNFDKAVSIILQAGMQFVECRQFANRLGGWESSFGWVLPVFYSATEYMMVNKEFNHAEATRFFSWFLPSYYNHLQQKQWLPVVLQHIADEPIPANEDSYIEFATFIKQAAPKLKIIEAIATKKVLPYVDVVVVPLGSLREYLPEIVNNNIKGVKQFWLYTSIHPQGEFANRFIELPLIKTTLLPWIVAKYNMQGYLHWGLNFWGNKPFENASRVQFAEVYEFPAGDAYLVYPGDKTVNPSIRALAMRNGLNDVALLTLLKQKDAAVANLINTVLVKDVDQYEVSSSIYFKQKRRILQLLTAK